MQPSEFGESSRRTQEILRESEERFRLLVDGVKDYAIFMLDVEGRVTTWNLGAERIKGYESEEIIGEHFSIFYTHKDVERGRPEEVLWLAAADGRYEEQGIRVRKDGSTFWADVVITALRDEAGDLRGFAKVTRDITERKEAEERERLLVREQAARERATDILESISDAFYAVDEGWNFTYVNGKAEELWGRSRKELLGKNIWEEFPQAVDSESYRQIKRAMEEGVTTEFETISAVLDAWVAGRAYPSREGLSVYFQDVTERKRAEQEIRQSAERYRSFVEQSTEGIWRFELEESLPADLPEEEQVAHFYRHAYLAECNDVLARMYGFTRAEEIVEARLEAFLPRSVPENVEYLLAFIRSGYRLANAESEEMDREGKPKRFLNNLTGIVQNGLLVRAWGTQRDVTEQRWAQEELRGSRDQLEAILRGAADGITAQDSGGQIIYANETAARLVGFPSARDLVVAPLDELMARFELLDEEGRPFPVDRLPGRRALAGEEGAEEVLRFRILATGEERCTIVKAMPIFTEQGTVRMAVNIFRDITESKQAEESLRRVTETERKRIARDLHDGVLQDLSYTAAAIGLIMLRAEDAGLKEQLQAAVDAVRRGAQGLREVVDDLRIEDEEGRPFTEIVESVVRRSRTMARGIEISLEMGEQVPSEPLGETGTQVSRIIQEALTNARRHSGANKVSVSLAMDGDDLLVEVSDDGHGFGPETPPGVGLGSMRERAVLIGAELEIESEAERGASVRLQVPLSRRVLQ
jgi:PAS domain S-box-containing protein